MARIYPFRGLRFNPERIGCLEDVVTQPYDKISEAQRERYLKRSPHNIVRVIRNSNYEEAARLLNDWIRTEVLVREERASLYIYRQVFQYGGSELARTGIIALVSLEDGDLVVRGHEKILDEPLADRLSLIRATRANEGLIFTLFSDPELRIDGLLGDYSSAHEPAVDVMDDYGVANRLWAVSDPAMVAEVSAGVRNRALYIADGHHRFQTSVLYHRECLAAGLTASGPESFDKRMIALFNMDGEGVRILPTHRGLRGLESFDPAAFLARLDRRFLIREAEDLEHLLRIVESGKGRIGVAWPSVEGLAFRVAEVKPEAFADRGFMPAVEGPLRRLDVSVLHEGILSDSLRISAGEVASGKYVVYFREARELAAELTAGRLQAGFFLKPTSLSEVTAVSEFGARMPQKSTDFFPKLLTGLVMLKMDMP
jgi:uncharacterized protein (DUF1015 family)